jgi:cytochrome c biogenesis protein CcdA|uniref:Cytochrome C biogenesis protein transmembrane domain-containing protein n=1 Tax=Thermomicrobium roseum TaxID=500 RepID=A0A7C1JMX8_THERO
MFVIATFLVGMVALLAYWLAYVHYPRFALPPLDVGLVFPLAVLAGLASLFSPCSFPLLLATFGTGATVSRPQPQGGLYWRVLGVAIGASTFFAVLGILVGLGAGKIVVGVTFPSLPGRLLRTLVGLVLLALAAAQIGVWTFPLGWLSRWGRQIVRRTGVASFGQAVLGGIGYSVAGFG